MRKSKYIFLFLSTFFLFLFTNKVINAEEYVISELPVSEDLIYGEPLFESGLNGGVSSVPGVFSWKNENDILEAGTISQKVIFTPSNNELNAKEFEVNVTIHPRRVYLSFQNDLYKQYDGSNVLRLPEYIVNGILGSEIFVRGNLVANLDSAFVGENINVTLSGIELVGEKKNNYYLDLGGFKATVYPKFIEMFGSVKNRIDFNNHTYVSMHSVIYVNEIDVSLEKEGYKIVKEYEVKVKNDNLDIDIKDNVKVKIKIDNFNDKGLVLYNYYNQQYEELDYVYEDGYLIYKCNGLGVLVLAEEIIDYKWMFITFGIMFFILFIIFVIYIVFKLLKNKKKINKYKSLKRRKGYGDN